jgi:type 2 lantibiotic biosynthesis protein LanM
MQQGKSPGRMRPSSHHWRLGLTLSERLDVLREADRPATPFQRSSKRLTWRKERHADIERARQIESRDTVEPLWWKKFWDLYRVGIGQGKVPAPENGLAVALRPILSQANGNVLSHLSRTPSSLLPVSQDSARLLCASFEQTLRQRLLLVVGKTLVLELGVASRAGLLRGNSPEDRFSFFCACLADHDFAASLLAQYPVLVRRCMAIATGWEKGICDLLSRLSGSESALLSEIFNGQHPGALISGEASGDTHGGGRAVHILTFEGGGKVVYKPRPVAMERHYYNLVNWLNDRGLEPDLKVVRTADHGAFGWMEFVPFEACDVPEQVFRFFRRMGAHLSLTHILGGTDLHSENVIASGEHPVPVDLETLFHTAPLPENLSGATDRASAELQCSVMRTLMLPSMWGFGEDVEDWIDISALGHTEDQLTPMPVADWAHVETDDMRLVYARATVRPGHSLPQLGGQQVRSGAHVEDIVRGFTETYEFLRQRKGELLSPRGPLPYFEGQTVRRVFRDTQAYASMLFSSCHPRFQCDAITCETMLRDELRKAAPPAQRPRLGLLEDAEVADLMSCDIPYFSSTLGSTDVRGSRGPTLMSDVGEPWRDCRSQIEAMSPQDLDRQISLIRITLHTPLTGVTPAVAASSSSDAPSPDALIATAARIGDRLCELALEVGDRCTWLGPEVINSRRITMSAAGIDLHAGLPGIALFLGHLSKVTGEDRYRRTAEAAMREARAVCRRTAIKSLKVGAFDGVGGLAYALVHFAAITGLVELAAEASAIIRRAAKKAAHSTDLDLCSGIAGFVVTGLAVARFNQDCDLIESLRPAAERLYREAMTSTRRRRKLSGDDAGLMHGRAGVGLSFVRWAEATGDDRFNTAAASLVRRDFEASEAARGKTLVKGSAIHSRDPLRFCRGSLGTALIALTSQPPLRDMIDSYWIEAAAREMARYGANGALCLCHGALSQLEILSFANYWDSSDDREVKSWRNALLNRIVGGDWVADTVHAFECPGLMTGLAGTGYSLLRMAVGSEIPSVLVLADVHGQN